MKLFKRFDRALQPGSPDRRTVQKDGECQGRICRDINTGYLAHEGADGKIGNTSRSCDGTTQMRLGSQVPGESDTQAYDFEPLRNNGAEEYILIG